jgi:hypothetical protein
MSTRYLTKSRFKLACECPTKLFYTKKKVYGNKKLDDPFLEALADSGFQVGELAKCYFPGGIDITSLSYEDSLSETNKALERDEVSVFEAAVRHENLFIRVDVLNKKRNKIELLEVKAKSIDRERDTFLNKKGDALLSDWKPYLLDIAFQTYVTRLSFPDTHIEPYLYLVDKTASCPTDGLHQKFKVRRNKQGRKEVVVVEELEVKELTDKLLVRVPVSVEVEGIINGDFGEIVAGKSFAESVEYFSSIYMQDKKHEARIKTECGKCEFVCTKEELAEGKRDGKDECFNGSLGFGSEVPTVLDIWDFKKKDTLIEAGAVKLTDVSEEDIGVREDERAGLSRTERQWLQVKKSVAGDTSPYIDVGGLKAEFEKLEYPLHFIDFETIAVAIPFNEGRRPYQGRAFQFSHHEMSEDGSFTHKTEFLETRRGVNPNYQFLRALRDAVGEEGSIFMYSPHENSYLNMLYREILIAPPEDGEELKEFIQSISKSSRDSIEKWEGPRKMIDLCKWVKRYYYDPMTGGSNSIKQVLPAVLNSSEFLKEKYSKPIYGSEIASANFEDFTWIELDEAGKVIDPYTLLPKVFSDLSEHDRELLNEETELKDGGAAMTAYARLQFSDVSEVERVAIEEALLKYCELDTLAMIMLFEGHLSFTTGESL